MWWIIGLLAAAVAYLRWIRPWQLRWGAGDDEVTRPMPGDLVVDRPHFNATRAITVKGAPAAIWPWIVQIGFNRAGWYSYDWVDNLGRSSADRILPEFQHLQVGDLIPIYADMGFYVEAMEPERWMLWVDKPRRSTWYWGLYPQPDGSTRLITRVRLRYRWLSPTILFSLMLDVGDIIMMRKCMQGIKERAERSA